MLFYKQTALLTLILLPSSIGLIHAGHAETTEDKQRWQSLLEQSQPDDYLGDETLNSKVLITTNTKESEDILVDEDTKSMSSLNVKTNQQNIPLQTSKSSIPAVTSIDEIETSLKVAEQVFSDKNVNPTAKLDGSSQAIELDKSLIIPPNLFSDVPLAEEIISEKSSKAVVATVTTINPNDFLPLYQESAVQQTDKTQTDLPATEQTKSQSILQKAQSRLFGNTSLAQQPKIFATLYISKDKIETNEIPTNETHTASQSLDAHYHINQLTRLDTDVQPYKNIEAALENIYQDTVTDFPAALPILKKTAEEAAEAVGYFDVKMSFQQPDYDELAVIIESVGEPVLVDSRVIDVRGEGQELEVFQTMEKRLPPLSGEVFNQGEYLAAKNVIETSSSQLGFFDSKWLNSSADVILPDNIADVDLVYDTGQRYQFGEVVFFTIDEATGKLTTDPDKLPVNQEILQQLVGFKDGQGYNHSQVNEFRNDLVTTRYFNSINVEEVMPADAYNGENNAIINFESIAITPTSHSSDNPLLPGISDSEDAQPNDANDLINGFPVDVALVAFPNMPMSGIDNLAIDSLQSTSTNVGSNNLTTATNSFDGTANSIIDSLISQSIDAAIDEQQKQTQRQLAAITFSIDDSTSDKYNAIEKKANRLLLLPDDRVLNEQTIQANNTLGKISNAVSSVAKLILPEKTEPKIPLGSKRPVLANKKTPEQVLAEKKVPLYVLVMANKPYDAQIGVGYGTDTGFRTTAKLDNNLINRDGYQAGVSAEWSNVQKKAGVYVSRPWNHPLDDTLSANLSYEETKINQGNADNDWNTKSVLASIARNRFSDKNWSRSYSLRHRYDELDIGKDITADPDDVPVRFSSSNPKQQAVLLGYSMQKTEVDDLTNPEFGLYQRYSLEAGIDGVGTDTNMAIARAGISSIYSFGEENKHQVIGKLNTGYLWADDFYDVPYTLRFFAGGDQSIRGYDYNSLSPVDNGYLTGGQVLAVGSAEYNYEFKEGLRGAVFADMGNAYDEDFTTPTKLGLGFGIRWASPVGPVRVDVGAGVTEESIPIRLHLFIGSPL